MSFLICEKNAIEFFLSCMLSIWHTKIHKLFIKPKSACVWPGVCNFCNGGVNFVLDNDPEG
jgi:hypothetical protein